MKILIDNGHGRATAGKRSPVWPDGKQLFEYEFNRDIARRMHEALTARGNDRHAVSLFATLDTSFKSFVM